MTRGERKLLYGFFAEIAAKEGQSIKATIREALGKLGGVDDAASFRKGSIGRPKAARAAQWVKQHHPAVAHAFEAALAASRRAPATSDWAAFLRENGRYAGVEVLRFPIAPPIGIVTFAALEPVADLRLRVRERFCFRISGPRPRTIAGLQIQQGASYLLPLSEETPIVQVPAGKTFLPRSPSGEPLPWEETQADLHGFVFIAADDPARLAPLQDISAGTMVDMPTLDRLAGNFEEVSDQAYNVYRCNVLFDQ